MDEAGVHLGVLGLRPGADSGEIKRAFRALAKRHHPDKNPNDVAASSERFRRVNDAYQFLIDAQDRGGRRPPNSPPAADAAFATRARREAEARAAKRDTAQRAAAEERRREAQRAAAKVRAAKLEEMREAQQRQRDERDRCDEAERRHEAEAQRQRDAFERDRRDEIARLAREARVREAGRKVAADRRLAEDRASRLAAEAHRAAALAAAREEEQKRQWDAALRQSAQAAEAQLRFSSEAARVQRERWRVDGESDEGDASMVDDDAEWWRLNREGAAPFNLQNTAAADRGGEAFDADECWGAFETASEALRKARDIRAAKVDKNQQQDGWTTRAESEAFYASCVGAAEAVLGPAGYNPGRYEVQRGPANVTNEAAYAAAQAEVAGAGRAATKADSAAEELESLLRAFGHLAPEFVYQHHREQQAQQQQQEEQQQEQQQRWRPPIPAPVQNGASFDRRRPRDPDLTPTLDEVFNDAAKQRHARFQAAMHRREQAERGAILARGAAKRLRVVEAASGSVELEWDDEAGVAALKWQLQWCARGGAWEDAPRLLEATRCRKRNLASDTDYRFRARRRVG